MGDAYLITARSTRDNPILLDLGVALQMGAEALRWVRRTTERVRHCVVGEMFRLGRRNSRWWRWKKEGGLGEGRPVWKIWEGWFFFSSGGSIEVRVALDFSILLGVLSVVSQQGHEA